MLAVLKAVCSHMRSRSALLHLNLLQVNAIVSALDDNSAHLSSAVFLAQIFHDPNRTGSITTPEERMVVHMMVPGFSQSLHAYT